MADKEKDNDVPKVYTPFGVMVGDAGAYKPFDDESFYEEVLKPSEKETLKVFKKDFLEDPDKKLPDGVVAGFNFYAWDRPLITSGGRVPMVLDRILSNTWALDKNAIPDFVDLIEKLRQKYSTVLGDDDLLKHLEAAQHRARELEATGEAAIGSSRQIKSSENYGRNSPNDSYVSEQQRYGRQIQEEIETMFGGSPEQFVLDYLTGNTEEGVPRSESDLRYDLQCAGFDPSIVDDCLRQLGFIDSSRKISSAVDQQSYDNYIQQLVSQGIPEDQARQMADSLVNNLQESTTQFATEIQQTDLEDKNNQFSGLMSNHSRGGRIMNRRFIKSNDELDEDIGNDEELDTGSDISDAGADEGGNEDPLDFGSPNEDGDAELADGFMDEVNSIEDFGADSPTLTKEEIVDAVQAISQIVETVLSTEGEENGQNLTSDEVSFTLDEVGDLAAGFDSDAEAGDAPPEFDEFDEGGFDEDLDEEFPEEVAASLVRVVQAGKPINSKFAKTYVTPEKFANEPALVCQGFNTSLQVTDFEPKPEQTYETMVLSHVADPSKGTVNVGFMKLGDIKKWIKQSKSHKIAWRIASSKLKRILKSEMKSPREKSAIQALANSYYTKWFIPQNKLSEKISAKSARVLRRVCHVIHNRYVSGKPTKVILSDYNGYRNYETWNAAVYIENNRDVYNKALNFVKSGGTDYNKFLASSDLANGQTPDGVAWSSPRIDRKEMNEVLASLTSSFGKGKGMKGVKSNVTTPNTNQVDKDGELVTVQDDTRTGLDLSGETPKDSNIEDDNNTRLTNVDGGDTSEINDVHNTGDDGSLEADEKAGTEEDVGEYGFDSLEMVGVELPIEEEEDTQVLELKHIGSGIYILHQSYVTPGSGRVSFCKGVEANRLIRNNTRPSPIKSNLTNRVLTLKDGKSALLLRSSSILGVIGIEAPFIKGLKNSSYSVFSRKGINLVNSAGDYLTQHKGSQHVITSSVSNKSVRHGGSIKRDIFAEVERAYVGFLNNRIHRLLKANAHLNRRLDETIAANKRQALESSRMYATLKNSARHQVASGMRSLNAVREQAAQAEIQRVMSSTQEAIREEALNAKARQEKIMQNHERLMRW